MAVLIDDIALAAGVSKSTVSKILNGADAHISEKTRNKVLTLVKEMDYTPNQLARGLKIKQTRMLGFLLPDISNPFFPAIAKGIEDAARKNDFSVVMCNTNNDPEMEMKSFRLLTSRMMDGIIFIRSLRECNFPVIFNSGIPVVVVNREIDLREFGFGQVYVDSCSGIRRSTEILIGAGCRRIAYISANYHYGTDRMDGYRQALNSAGMAFFSDMVYRNQFDVPTGYNGILSVLEKQAVDGVVCGNDLIAIGVMNALRERGIAVPGEVKVMGFDDMYFAQHVSPPLSTIRQPAYEMGAQAAKMLIANILRKTPLARRELPFEVCLRGTV